WTGAPYQAGWPVGPPNVIYSSVCIDDLDGDGSLEIVVGSKDQHVHVWEHDGTERPGWPRPTGDMVWSSPCIANLDSDPEKEILAGSNDGKLYGWNHDGTGIRNEDGFFRSLGGDVRGAPTVDDIDGDLDLEILISNSYGEVFCWHHEGTGYLQPNGSWGHASGSIYSSVGLADFDGDDSLEVIAGGTGGGIYIWNHDGTGYLNPDGFFVTTNSIYGSVAIGDVEGNGDMEVVMGGMFWQGVAVYDDDATFSVGWPKNTVGYVRSSPALADLDGDDRLDIIVGTSRVYLTDDSCYVYVFSHDGIVRPGWPKASTGEFESSPVVGDIDGDGDPEILIGCTDNHLYAWHADGTPVKGWPRYVIHEIYSTPAICDLDGDGDVEVVVGGYDGLVHVFDLSAPYDPEAMEWPKHNHDTFNSQLYGGPSKAGVEGDEPGGLPAKLMLMAYPSPAVSNVTVRLGVPSTNSGEYSVDVFDVRGRHIRNLVNGTLDAGYHNASWDCEDSGGRQVSSGIYFVKVSGKHADLTRKLVVVR
ncbi:MAG: FG-GAP-like repeat-containing protein, partial [bacterium]